MLKSLTSFLALPVAMSALSAQVFEKGKNDPREALVAPHVLRVVSLSPDPDTESEFQEIQLEYMSDGKRLLRAKTHRLPPGEFNEAFNFVVDAEAGTYRMTRAEPEVQAKSSSTERVHPDAPEPGDGCCDNVCSGNMTAYMQTLDLVLVQLTRTTATGNWRNVDDYLFQDCKWSGSGSGTCIAANPSALGTHWFTSSCQRFGPVTSYFYFNETVTGNYYNWDFGNDNLRTDVSQFVTIYLNAGSLTVDYGHLDSGESSGLIFGSIAYNGINSCTVP